MRQAIEDYLAANKLAIEPAHRVHNLTMAMSLIASTRGMALLPAYAENFLPWSVTSRPLKGTPPTIDLVVGYKRDNASPTLALFLPRLARIGKKEGRVDGCCRGLPTFQNAHRALLRALVYASSKIRSQR